MHIAGLEEEVARRPVRRRNRSAHHLPGFSRSGTGSATASRPACPRPLLQSDGGRLQPRARWSPVQRLHVILQGTGADTSIPGNSQAGGILGGEASEALKSRITWFWAGLSEKHKSRLFTALQKRITVERWRQTIWINIFKQISTFFLTLREASGNVILDNCTWLYT